MNVTTPPARSYATGSYDIMRSSALGYLFNHMELELLDSGYALLDTRWTQREVCSPYSRLYYILSGEGILEDTAGRELRMTPGKLYFVPSGMTFHYRCERALEKVYFHLTVRGADRYDLLAGRSEFAAFPCPELAAGSFLSLYRGGDSVAAAQLQAILWRDVAAILSALPVPSTASVVYTALVRRAIGYIRAHLSNNLRTEDIASALFVSSSCLASRFRREVGISIGRYIDDMVAFRARELLLRDELSIGEISTRLGFCDQFYFARKFRRIHGEAPGAFRRRQKNIF